MTTEPKLTAPYVPFPTFLHTLDLLAGLGGMPQRVDHSVFPSMNGVARGQVLSAFKFLQLINDNNIASPTLGKLAMDQEERKAILKQIIEARYPDIVVHLATMSQGQLDSALNDGRYNVSGATRQKARSFLLKAAEYTGMPLSKLLTTKGVKKKPRTNGSKAVPVKSVREKVEDSVPVHAAPLALDPKRDRVPVSLSIDRVAFLDLPKDLSKDEAKKLLALLTITLDVTA